LVFLLVETGNLVIQELEFVNIFGKGGNSSLNIPNNFGSNELGKCIHVF
jgi:hypothetical protein